MRTDDLCAIRCVRVWLVAGPKHWADSYSECGGRKQSPIDIKQGEATYKDIGNLALSGYDITAGHVFQLENNGHTGTLLLYRFCSQLVAAPRIHGGVFINFNISIFICRRHTLWIVPNHFFGNNSSKPFCVLLRYQALHTPNGTQPIQTLPNGRR